MEATKKCKKCGREMPLSWYNTCARHKDGKQSYCKDCDREYQRQRLAKKNAEKGVVKTTPPPSQKALKDYSPRELMTELYIRGYEGELTYTEVHRIKIDKTLMQ